MSFLRQLRRLLEDPPPEFIFEVSEAGISVTRHSGGGNIDFHPLPSGVLSVSPLVDNVLQPDTLAWQVKSILPPTNSKKRRKVAIILPDYCSRLTVLDFDSFPKDPAEQNTLVRFRVKKSVPFDVDSAAVAYHVQPRPGSKTLDVVVVVTALEIIARYEAPFRAAGLQPGLVTISAVSALNLVPATEGPLVYAKLAGRVITVSVVEAGALKMVRCLELSELNHAEFFTILMPTIAYMEDELKRRPEKVIVSGFGDMDPHEIMSWEQELGVPVEALRSRFGLAGQNNAGLLGYLEGEMVN
jgi:type IV pilus assembly protein PilM